MAGPRPADDTGMRIRAFAVAVLAVALSGCWVLDELSSGSKKMDMYTKKKPGAEESGGDAPAAPGRRMRANEYFASQKNARQLTPGTVSADIVSCKLKSGTQFMKQSECEARGGTSKH
jgi:hypothetical protein